MRNKYKGQDVRNRLNATLIRYKNVPVICKTSEDGSVLNLWDFKNKANLIATVDPDDPDIDISSISLGYVQFPNQAVYVKRMPRRIYKQGIDVQHLEFTALNKNGDRHIEYSQFYTQSVFQSLTNKFPALSVAIAMLTKEKAYSVALSRDVAILRDGKTLKFYIKEVEVGFSQIETPSVVVIPKTENSWVHSLYLEEINGVRVVEGL